MFQPESTAERPLRVALIDGKPLDALLLRERLGHRRDRSIAVTHRASLDLGLAWLGSHGYDLVLLDPSLTRSGGDAAVRAVVRAARPAPVVVLAARHDPDVAARYFRMGVQDYVAKGEIDHVDLERVLRHAVERQRVVSKLHEARRKAEHSATHDALTGLPGRTLFLDRARRALAAAERHGGAVGLLFIDLDGFKQVNDTLGHEAGDRLLAGVAERLRTGVRTGDVVARFGGDEFVVLGDRLTGPEDTRKVAELLEAKLSRPISIGRYRKRARISIGGATYPTDGADIDALLRKADQAMYRAKRARVCRGRSASRRSHRGPSLFAQ